MQRIATLPTPRPTVRRRDLVAFVWHVAAHLPDRQRRAELALTTGDTAALYAVWREAEMQTGLAITMAREMRGGVLADSPPPPPPVLPPVRRGLLQRIREAWRVLTG